MDCALSLPDDVIHHILSFFESRHRILALLFVSKQWNRVATGHPLYWKKHQFDSQSTHKESRQRAIDAFNAGLRCSGTRPIKMQVYLSSNFYLGEDEHNTLLLSIISEHLRHAETMVLCIPCCYHKRTFNALSTPAPMLASASLLLSTGNCNEDPRHWRLRLPDENSSPPSSLFARDAPRLKHLSLCDLTWDVAHYPPVLQNLDRLELEFYTAVQSLGMPNPQLHLAAPRLRELVIKSYPLLHPETLQNTQFWNQLQRVEFEHPSLRGDAELTALDTPLRGVRMISHLASPTAVIMQHVDHLVGPLEAEVVPQRAARRVWTITSIASRRSRSFRVEYSKDNLLYYGSSSGVPLPVLRRATFQRIVALRVAIFPAAANYSRPKNDTLVLPALESLVCVYHPSIEPLDEHGFRTESNISCPSLQTLTITNANDHPPLRLSMAVATFIRSARAMLKCPDEIVLKLGPYVSISGELEPLETDGCFRLRNLGTAA